MDFMLACENNDIELAKTYRIPDKQILDQTFIDVRVNGHLKVAQWLHSLGADISAHDNKAFKWACLRGYLDIAQWLHSLGADIYDQDNFAFRYACKNGHLNVAQWLHSLDVNIYDQDNDAFIYAYTHGHLNVAKWLHSLCVSDQNNNAIRRACYNNKFMIVKWLIDIHYKYGGYIEFDNYTYFSDDIKNLLIDNNLIDPSTLSESDLTYYLTRTDNVVPPDFTTKHDGFEVKYRGKHTKPAPRE